MDPDYSRDYYKTSIDQHIQIRIVPYLLVKEDIDITACSEISRGAIRPTLSNDCPIHGHSTLHRISSDEYHLEKNLQKIKLMFQLSYIHKKRSHCATVVSRLIQILEIASMKIESQEDRYYRRQNEKTEAGQNPPPNDNAMFSCRPAFFTIMMNVGCRGL